MERKPDEEICLLVRDPQTRRFLFNAKALRVLGINAVEAQQRGYPIEGRSPMADFSPAVPPRDPDDDEDEEEDDADEDDDREPAVIREPDED